MIERLQTPIQLPPKPRPCNDRAQQAPEFLQWLQDQRDRGSKPAETTSPSSVEYGPGEDAGQPGWPQAELSQQPRDGTTAATGDARSGLPMPAIDRHPPIAFPYGDPSPPAAGPGNGLSGGAHVEDFVGVLSPPRDVNSDGSAAAMSAVQPMHPMPPSADGNDMAPPVERWVELHVRDASGRSEIIALPWRLLAGGGLGHRTVFGDGTASPTRADGGGDGVNAFRASRPPPPQVVTAVSGALARRAEKSNGVGFVSLSSSAQSCAENDTDGAPAMRDVPQPAADEWSTRWMRWIERDGRLSAAWIRDYASDEERLQRLTGEILAFCREQKLPLQRIVINGHERWSSADARQAREAVCR